MKTVSIVLVALLMGTLAFAEDHMKVSYDEMVAMVQLPDMVIRDSDESGLDLLFVLKSPYSKGYPPAMLEYHMEQNQLVYEELASIERDRVEATPAITGRTTPGGETGVGVDPVALAKAIKALGGAANFAKENKWIIGTGLLVAAAVGENNDWFQHGNHKGDTGSTGATFNTEPDGTKTAVSEGIATGGGRVFLEQENCPERTEAHGVGSEFHCKEIFPPETNP